VAGARGLPSKPTLGVEATAGSAAGTSRAESPESPAGSSTAHAAPRRRSTSGSAGSDNNARRGPVMMWPFTSASEVRAWEASYRQGGHQPWHTSPCDTASSFLRSVLAYSDVTEIARCEIRGDQAWVTAGYPVEGRVIPTGAAIHLARIGSDPGGWVVIGSQHRATLTLTTPRYGAPVTRRIHLAGQVSGLGEDLLTVRILDPFGHTLGQAPPRLIGLGGSWSADIRLRRPPTGAMLIAVASTDSGLGSLGDLALTALVLNS
jgi:hypothetical protein